MEATLKRQVQQQNTSFQEVQRRFLQALEISKTSPSTPRFPNMAMVKIPIFNREYIFNPGPCSIASHVSLLEGTRWFNVTEILIPF